ncbi:hypothetical protein RGQ29_008120 [Quercus rubra]|uniref:DUF1997 family protein n=1 Tax=Quercus rubra TaxID=3512 RepID=A0AAN7I4I2_QUERU|nr:hypothetical protein RGQ29_008120 [Quercus rubra]KAK4558702.1 hypothetical protein RGQ29_008120 [Quercus rubra]KAK4558703.1 hypothetical protein RGQ29_008120 [Quercus rubra]KAK4558704.1 hypothetical protein RGQ29_008120 [Quercus rubra]
MLTIKWHGRGQGCASFLSSPILKPNTRKKTKVIKLNISTPSESNIKKANLSATRKERIKLPNYDDDCCGGKTFHISEFLCHPSGIQAMLNTSSLESFQALDTKTYRCFLPKVRLLNFEAAPVLDLRVTPTNEDCTVEMLSCKFEGSEIMERQNNHFSASMLNHMTWKTNDFESFLEVEIYTRPFTMMPVSSVERPGNLMMQALVDRLFPLHLQQLLQDYDKWVHQQLDNIL